MYLMGQLFAAFYFVLLCVHGGSPMGGSYVFESAVEVVNAFDSKILSWELGAGSSEPAGPAKFCRPSGFQPQ
jgi:hypothetical protein